MPVNTNGIFYRWKNDLLLEILNTPAKSYESAEDRKARNNALDALLTVDLAGGTSPAIEKAFNDAIRANLDFWKKINPDFITDSAGMPIDNSSHLVHNTLLGSEPVPADRTYSILKQKAAEQRVMLGLKNVDLNVLIGMLTNNPDECRAYLAKQEQLGLLKNAKGWAPDIVVPAPVITVPPTPPSLENKDVTILTKEAVERIQKEALNTLLLKLTGKPGVNKDLVKALLDAPDQPRLLLAAQNLGFTNPKALAHLTHPLNPIVRQTCAKDLFIDYVRDLPKADLKALENSLKTDSAAIFLDGLVVSYRNDLKLVNNGSDARGIFAARYLQVVLSSSDKNDNLLLAINSEDVGLSGVISTALYNDRLDYYYVQDAIAYDKSAVKKGLLQGIISHLKNTPVNLAFLQELHTAKNLDDLKAGLTKLGLTKLDWINTIDLDTIKVWSRTRTFEMLLNNTSKFGAKAHPELVKAFSTLPLDKQESLLAKSAELHHLLKASKASDVEIYLGSGIAGVAEIVKENTRLAGFQQIQNVSIAKVLQSLKPPIILKELDILLINSMIKARKIEDYKNPQIYKELVEAIGSVFNVPDMGPVYKAFGVRVEGRFYTRTRAVSLRADIENQHKYNTDLFKAANNHPPAETRNKELIDILLCIRKTKNLENVHISTLDGYFKESPDLITFLSKIPDTLEFKDIKTRLTNELTGPVFDNMKQNVRISDFKAILKEVSKLGETAHPALVEAFKTLPIEKQNFLLKPENVAVILQIVVAKDLAAVKFYLGKDLKNPVLKTIVDENVTLGRFQQIQNVALAKILQSYKPAITLSDDKVKAINDVIKKYGLGNIYKDHFVDKIKIICNISTAVDNASLYKAMGLTAIGGRLPMLLTPDPLDQPRIDIEKQQANNIDLIEADANHKRNKDLINILLRIEKKVPIDDLTIKKIEETFKNSTDLKDFLSKVAAFVPPILEIHAGLTKELTSTSFDQIKIKQEVNLDPSLGLGLDLVAGCLKAMKEKIVAIEDTRKPFAYTSETRNRMDPRANTAEKFEFINKINPLHFCDPALQSTTEVAKMKEEYQLLSNKCDLIVDQLYRNKAKLEAYRDNLPDSVGHITEPHWNKNRDALHKIKEKIKAELAGVNKDLAYYTVIQAKLADPADPKKGILAAIDVAAKGGQNYYYQAGGFTVRLDDKPPSVPTGASATTLATHTSAVDANYLKADRFKTAAHYDFKQKNGDISTTGSFVETRQLSGTSSTLQGNSISKTEGSRFTIDNPPKTTVPPAQRGQPQIDANKDPRGLRQKADFYMGLAVAILARYEDGKPPTKKNPIRMNGSNEVEMKHIWTALVVLGEKGPKKMRFDRDAISVDSGPFNPANERDSTLGISHWKKDSLYSTLYTTKDTGADVGKKIESAKALSSELTAHQKEVDKAAKGIQKFKSPLSEGRTEAEKKALEKAEEARKEVGPAPVSSLSTPHT